MFTGVSGSGKSSLVFGTIAAESQRLINETYPAFVQQFMPHYGQPDADELENISAAIIVDQQRLGGNSRSTVATVTDAAQMLRVLFARCREPEARRAWALFLQRPARHVPRMRRHRPGCGDGHERGGRRSRSRSTRAPCCPRTSPSIAGGGRSTRIPGLFDMDKPISEVHRGGAREPVPPRRWPQDQGRQDRPHLRGRGRQAQEGVGRKDPESLQPHVRRRVRQDLHPRDLPGLQRRPARIARGAGEQGQRARPSPSCSAMQVCDLAPVRPRASRRPRSSR